ncbi:MAG: phosphoglycerate dehydrogenase [Dehalococcoidia bacterium]|uniref:phosphoglycerate dehydrogenase n=1 Tax=Candidatus Amarobacter glycogenicus TaxID=3140699 RepID=UPI0031356DC5|nr:phosphoglycerate dehydrogenase [Dehalococcoidia bacterium]MBK8558622.1 phosphoglycerate dehydrogenase [Dehalococcoidia bacterium]MCC6268490.1 phosphoglycerate dehydrogenase [Dehalococcoidia bacterium]
MNASEFSTVRSALGLSQSGMAAALGVDQGTISRWESGKVRIPAAIELALATLQENPEPMPETRRPRILIADPVAPEGIELLRAIGDVEVKTGQAADALIASIENYDALVVRSETKVTRAIIEAGVRLQVIGRAGVGVDNIDLEAATERGVIVVNAPQGNTIAAAEHTIALLMALARHIPQADASMRAGKWDRKSYVGTEVRGKTLGVIGLGPIGSEVARRGVGLDMRVLGHDPYVAEERTRSLGAEPADFETLISVADFISVHVPMTAATKGMISTEQFARMKDGVRLLNVARGGIIDEAALAAAVQSGKVAGAAVDVFTAEPIDPENPLLGDPRIITTPHLGASTAEAQERVAVDVAEQIVDVLAGRPARYAVNAPMLAPETLKVVGPYMAVAEIVGTVATQLVTGKLKSIELEYLGEIAEYDTTPLKASIIRGLLKPISEETVNIVNANIIAQSRGWDIAEQQRTSHAVFNNLVNLKVVTSDDEVTVSGTVVHDHAHIVLINGLDVDLAPERGTYLLACDNEDRPGMIGRVGTLLGEFDINIQSMQVGRRGRRGRALMLIAVDEAPSQDQLDAIEAIAGIYNVRLVRF